MAFMKKQYSDGSVRTYATMSESRLKDYIFKNHKLGLRYVVRAHNAGTAYNFEREDSNHITVGHVVIKGEGIPIYAREPLVMSGVLCVMKASEANG